jgi:hypothetical protein
MGKDQKQKDPRVTGFLILIFMVSKAVLTYTHIRGAT